MHKSFRELRVWQSAVDLTILIYGITGDFPKHEIYGLSSQMRRAAVSTASNIAEGSGRPSSRDFRHFVPIARGSNFELQTQLTVAIRLGYGVQSRVHEAEILALDVGKMLNGLSNFLKQKAINSRAT